MPEFNIDAVERFVRDPKRREVPINMAIALVEEVRRLEREATTPRGRADGILLAVSIADAHVHRAADDVASSRRLSVLADALRAKYDAVLSRQIEDEAIDVFPGEP
jgi:hypothetical protein